MHLVGRVGEMAACLQALSEGQGRARAAVIMGPPGIGKTSLWRAVAAELTAARAASGAVRLLRTTGVPGAGTALAAVADLVDPVLDSAVRGLPAPLANALLAAVGQLSAQAPVTDVLLERAVVRLCRGLAETGLLIAIDDEQWLDEDSRRLLAAAAVRLADTPVRWLLSVRADSADDGLARALAHALGPGAVRVDLAGLADDALSELITSRFPGEWSTGVLRQVVTLAAGNPYAALEIARETVARGARNGTAAVVPPSMDTAVRQHLARLGPEVLRIAQAAALAAAPARDLLRTLVGDSADEQVNAALEAGVLVSAPPDPVLRFSHPLLREAAESMLSDTRRRELHRLIGAALEDPHEAAWHLAHGAEAPDEALAGRLEAAVKDAAVRGASARAAMLARFAVDLTPDAGGLDGWRRRLLWLLTLLGANEYGQVRRHGAQWAADVPASLRGLLDVMRSRVAADTEVQYELLASSVADLAGQEPVIAALAYAEAALICGIMLGRLDQGRGSPPPRFRSPARAATSRWSAAC